jgi:hypothetical protein
MPALLAGWGTIRTLPHGQKPVAPRHWLLIMDTGGGKATGQPLAGLDGAR